MDRLRSVEIFLEVVRCGSMAGASKTLSITPQMVGQHVRDLEARVGATLLHRTTRRIGLTEAGKIYHDDCRRIVDLWAKTHDRFQELQGEASGTLTIAAPFRWARILSRRRWSPSVGDTRRST